MKQRNNETHSRKDGKKEGKGADVRSDGWCGPDREYWSLFALGGGAAAARERVRFLETLGVAFAFLSRRFGPFLTSPSPGTGTSETLARALARAVAVVGLVGAVDANARIG